MSNAIYSPSQSQVRFELAWKALDQKTKTIIPWRIPEFCERFASVPLPAPAPLSRRC